MMEQRRSDNPVNMVSVPGFQNHFRPMLYARRFEKFSIIRWLMRARSPSFQDRICLV